MSALRQLDLMKPYLNANIAANLLAHKILRFNLIEDTFERRMAARSIPKGSVRNSEIALLKQRDIITEYPTDNDILAIKNVEQHT